MATSSIAPTAAIPTGDNDVNGQHPYSGSQIQAAYQAIYGGLPASMMDLETGDISGAYEDGVFPGAVLQTPTGEPINASQLMYMYQAGQQQQQQPQAQQAQSAQSSAFPAPSYLSGASAPSSQGNPMATSSIDPQTAVQYFVSKGGSPTVNPQTAMQYYQAMNPGAASGGSASSQNAFGITSTDSGKGYTTLTNSQNGQTVNVDSAGNYFTTDAQGNNTPVTDQQAQTMGFQSTNPETQAIKQMQQIDPGTEALRSQLATSYTDPNAAANPTAAQYQSYLNTFKQVDPTEYAERAGLSGSMDSYLKSQQQQYNLGSQLDPVTQMQVEQQARKAQADRGNLYGSGQAAVEAMTTGQAGQALLQQRTANLQSALGGQQSYLGAGLGLGDTAMSLYQQGLQNKANAQQSALSYLTSGATPYQAGASYLNQANANAANAAQGGPVYNPTALGAGNLGTAQQAPQYGLDVGAQSQNYFNSLNNAYGGGAGGTQKNKTASAATGALSGAVSGAAAGSVVPVYGTAVGAVVGGVAGGLGGYYS